MYNCIFTTKVGLPTKVVFTTNVSFTTFPTKVIKVSFIINSTNSTKIQEDDASRK